MKLSKLLPITLLSIALTVHGDASIKKTWKDTKASIKRKAKRMKKKIKVMEQRIKEENRDREDYKLPPYAYEDNENSNNRDFWSADLKMSFALAQGINKGDLTTESLEALFSKIANSNLIIKEEVHHVLNALIGSSEVKAMDLALLSYPHTHLQSTHYSIAQDAFDFAFDFLAKKSIPPHAIETRAKELQCDFDINELYRTLTVKRYLEKILKGNCLQPNDNEPLDFIYYPNLEHTIADVYKITDEPIYIPRVFVDAIVTEFKEVLRRSKNCNVAIGISCLTCPEFLKPNYDGGYHGYFFPLAKAIKALNPNISIYSRDEINIRSFNNEQ